MKKFVLLLGALFAGGLALSAQTGDDAFAHARRFNLSIQGGPTLSLYENAFSYRDNGRSFDLIKAQAALSLGYDFTEAFGLRLQAAYGADAGAANTRQTAGGGFYPYTFKHVNGFVDAVLNLCGLKGVATAFRPRIYAGVGGAYTFGFTDAHHPWQKIFDRNTSFGFRAGFIAEYTTTSGLGFFADLCGEAYTDLYNGLAPSAEDQKAYEGYAGYPFDLRGILSLGLVYYF